ncbi:MAG: response regulator [Chloroflexota bacterium]|nr:response regulator [Chloroflexota bacterium]
MWEEQGNSVAGERVLVVDDEPYIVELLDELLDDEGYHVQRANDGITALEEIERRPPDLILADVMMPRLDGLTLAARLREWGDDTPIILMSAAVTPRDASYAFIAKPFDIEEMLGLVADMLQDRPTA